MRRDPPSTKIQLLAFVVISLLGMSYVGFNYVGLGAQLFGPGGCTVSANFPDSGGIFSNAEVTYRGVTVGKVGQLHLQDYQADGRPSRASGSTCGSTAARTRPSRPPPRPPSRTARRWGSSTSTWNPPPKRRPT